MKAFEWLRRKVTAFENTRCVYGNDNVDVNDDKSQVDEGVEVNDVQISKVERRHSNDDGRSLNAHHSALNSPNETLLVRAERTTFGMYVRRMGFEQVRRENKRYFAAKLQ